MKWVILLLCSIVVACNNTSNVVIKDNHIYFPDDSLIFEIFEFDVNSLISKEVDNKKLVLINSEHDTLVTSYRIEKPGLLISDTSTIYSLISEAYQSDDDYYYFAEYIDTEITKNSITHFRKCFNIQDSIFVVHYYIIDLRNSIISSIVLKYSLDKKVIRPDSIFLALGKKGTLFKNSYVKRYK